MPVYFVQAAEGGAIKIGFAKDISRRLHNLRCASPSHLILRGFVPGDLARERELHMQFSDCRLRGEWFSPDPPLLSFVQSLPTAPRVSQRRGRAIHDVSTPLADWMAANGMDDDALAAALDIDRSTASRFRRGKLVPSRKSIDKIVTLTGGAVQPNTFFGLPPAEMVAA